jgi:TRAP-type transport system periplasmic protein
MRIGQLHGVGFAGVGLGEVLPEVRIFDVPFLFRTDQEIDKVYNQLDEYFALEYDKKGYILLGWIPVGWVHMFSTRKIESVSDLVKSKPWVWEGEFLAQETYKALGVNPVPLAITDVLMSLQTGIINSIYGSSQGVLALQWFTQLKYMTALRMSHGVGGVLISKQKFEKNIK